MVLCKAWGQVQPERCLSLSFPRDSIPHRVDEVPQAGSLCYGLMGTGRWFQMVFSAFGVKNEMSQ
jgi:hypothetical protein